MYTQLPLVDVKLPLQKIYNKGAKPKKNTFKNELTTL